MKIVLTGGDGYIGRNLIYYLNKKFDDVDIVNFDLVSGNDYLSMVYDNSILDSDIIIHCAADSNISDNFYKTSVCLQNNLNKFDVVVNWLLSHNYKGRFVFFSSSAVYGNGDSIYGLSKKIGEIISKKLNSWYIIRPFNVIGSVSDVGFDTLKNDHIIPKIVYSFKNNKCFSVYGDGNSKRFYVHVENICNVIVDIINGVIVKNSVIDVGGDELLSVLDVIGIFERLVKSKLRIRFTDADERIDNPDVLIGDKSADYFYNDSSVNSVKRAFRQYL